MSSFSQSRACSWFCISCGAGRACGLTTSRVRRIDFAAAAVTCLCAVLAGACASSPPAQPSLASQFVRPGEPTFDYGDLPLAQPVSEGAAAKAPGEPVERSERSPAMSGPTIETTDQRLAAALLFETVAPSVDSHLQVAQEYRRLRIFDLAERRIQQAVRLDPKRADAHDAQARLWRDWGFPDQALGAAYRALAAAPGSAGTENTLGTVFGALGDWRAAAEHFARAAARLPSASWALSNWCYAEFSLGRLAEARARCVRALELDRDSRAARNNLGLVLAAMGDVEGAKAQFAVAGTTAAAEYNTGMMHAAMSDYEAAASAFERAIAARPDFSEAKARAHQARLNALEQQK